MPAKAKDRNAESVCLSGCYVRCGWFVYLDGIIWGFFAEKPYAFLRAQQLCNAGASAVKVEEAFLKST